ncbi:MAG TPA: hypothetical protein DEB09_04375 [Candidatus Magasanikbacteria bacterium]|nr:hypothetical protein [Candidatus Magasanikbacteria bacterium]
MTEEIINKVLEKIKHDKIEPKARWHFLLKDSLVWFLLGLSVVIGSLAIAVSIFHLENSDWEVYEKISGGPINFLFEILPFFWLIIFILFIIVAYFNFKHTKTGYRYNIFIVIGVSLFFTLCFGALAFIIGWGERLEDSLSNQIPFYPGLEHRRARMWARPDEGFLAGKILLINENNFSLVDLQDREWTVLIERAKLPPVFVIKIGDVVRVVGEVKSDNVFEAEMIMTEDMLKHMMNNKPRFRMMNQPPPDFERKFDEMRINR